MFIETRQSRKGKKVDQDTQVALTKLQESVQDSSESAGKTFQSLFGEEKPGRVRCLGRTVTPTMLKRNEEIAAINKQHSHEMNQMTKKMQGLEGLVRCLMKQVNPNLDDEALNNIMENALSNESSAAPRSSTSTHNPNYEKTGLNACLTSYEITKLQKLVYLHYVESLKC
ncbi:uncharacterized protein LOC130744758 [Lotus japonicus]|uniref:uncharacterized protein LOC130737255 n=1 Tax=Lotus japonicus TaxID=34305 RepID=UPI002585A3C6|nr:uncharacterized protein LOC130737255 [Lotus japonicus]XP_057452902.1 uncharacterized protein LOC130744758 [Lotus japonicus]